MKKIANLSFSISSREPVKKNPEVIQFSTQDTNTPILRFEIKNGKEPINLSDMTGEVSLKMKDNSRFDGKATVTDPLKGIIEYTITPEQIKHIGKGEGELILIEGTEKLAGLFFDFTILPSLKDKDLEPIKEYYIADLEAVKKEFYDKASKINVDLDALNAEIDTRVSDVEDKVNGFESNVAQATVVQVNAAKTNSKNKTYTDLKARMDYIEDGDIDCGTF